MTLVQDVKELNPVGQAAMRNPMVNYKLNLQTCYAATMEEAWYLFDGTAVATKIWESNQYWNMRGFPRIR